jgi:hypothetical protein
MEETKPQMISVCTKNLVACAGTELEVGNSISRSAHWRLIDIATESVSGGRTLGGLASRSTIKCFRTFTAKARWRKIAIALKTPQ